MSSSGPKPWKITTFIPDPFAAVKGLNPEDAVPMQVTDSWNSLRTSLGHNAPLNLQNGRARARALRRIVR